MLVCIFCRLRFSRGQHVIDGCNFSLRSLSLALCSLRLFSISISIPKERSSIESICTKDVRTVRFVFVGMHVAHPTFDTLWFKLTNRKLEYPYNFRLRSVRFVSASLISQNHIDFKSYPNHWLRKLNEPCGVYSKWDKHMCTSNVCDMFITVGDVQNQWILKCSVKKMRILEMRQTKLWILDLD